MPTPAKLVSAILFAALAWWTGETIVREVLPDGSSVGRLREVMAFMGLIIGWKVIGRATTGRMNRGTTVTVAITAGVAAAFVFLALGIVLHGFYEMIIRSLDSTYTEVGAAMNAMLGFIWDDVNLVANPVVLGTLFGGGALVGLIGGIVGRNSH
ncbi:MAG: TrgA family protein [Pseudomonadota bacterium]